MSIPRYDPTLDDTRCKEESKSRRETFTNRSVYRCLNLFLIVITNADDNFIRIPSNP